MTIFPHVFAESEERQELRRQVAKLAAKYGIKA